MGSDSELSLSDIDRDLPDAMRLSVANLMLAWGAYDSTLTYWLAKAAGIPLDAASILFGRMATNIKLKQITKLYKHHDYKDVSAELAALSKTHAKWVEIRNAVAHSRCVGRSRSDPDHFAFSAVEHVQGKPGMLAMVFIPTRDMHVATEFAQQSANKIMAFASNITSVVGQQGAEE